LLSSYQASCRRDKRASTSVEPDGTPFLAEAFPAPSPSVNHNPTPQRPRELKFIKEVQNQEDSDEESLPGNLGAQGRGQVSASNIAAGRYVAGPGAPSRGLSQKPRETSFSSRHMIALVDLKKASKSYQVTITFLNMLITTFKRAYKIIILLCITLYKGAYSVIYSIYIVHIYSNITYTI